MAYNGFSVFFELKLAYKGFAVFVGLKPDLQRLHYA